MPNNLFEKYKVNRKWYKKNPDSIHGILHAYRVLVFSYLLGIMEKGDIDSLCYASIFHDLRRYNDGYDKGHGKRAANWFKTNYSNFNELNKIYELIYWHDISDNLISNISKDLSIFKDADALDRFRIARFDKKYLRTKSAKKLINFAMAFYLITEKQKYNIKNPIKNIISAFFIAKKYL